MKTITLDDAEKMALLWFTDQNWESFKKSAEDFLTAEEIKKLAEKLGRFFENTEQPDAADSWLIDFSGVPDQERYD